jgi:hypothetical protein
MKRSYHALALGLLLLPSLAVARFAAVELTPANVSSQAVDFAVWITPYRDTFEVTVLFRQKKEQPTYEFSANLVLQRDGILVARSPLGINCEDVHQADKVFNGCRFTIANELMKDSIVSVHAVRRDGPPAAGYVFTIPLQQFHQPKEPKQKTPNKTPEHISEGRKRPAENAQR